MKITTQARRVGLRVYETYPPIYQPYPVSPKPKPLKIYENKSLKTNDVLVNGQRNTCDTDPDHPAEEDQSATVFHAKKAHKPANLNQ